MGTIDDGMGQPVILRLHGMAWLLLGRERYVSYLLPLSKDQWIVVGGMAPQGMTLLVIY